MPEVKKYIYALLVLFVLSLISENRDAYGQEEDNKAVKRQSMADRKKELAKKKEQQKAEDAKAMADLKQMHYENQDKKTQKRMKKAQKKANKTNSGKRGFSIRTWFAKKSRY